MPSLESLAAANTSENTQQAASSFHHLCKLSQILGDILPFVYSLQIDVEEVWRNLRKMECALDDWVMALPQYLRFSASSSSGVNGASNLWFSYLSVKVLICRLGFKVRRKVRIREAVGSYKCLIRGIWLLVHLLTCKKAALKDTRQTNIEARNYRLAMLRESASDIADFITLLTEAQLQEFWMPCMTEVLQSHPSFTTTNNDRYLLSSSIRRYCSLKVHS